MKKIKKYFQPKKLLFAVFCFVFSLFFCQKAQAQTITVPDDYPAIQAAVEAALSGDTVIVKDGVYEENIIIEKNGLVLKSQNGFESTKIKALDASRDAIKIGSGNVKLSGFWIEGSLDAAGVRILREMEGTEISGNKISENNKGILVESQRSNKIENNFIFENQYGIYLTYKSGTLEVLKNDLRANQNYGLYFESSWDPGAGIIASSSGNRFYLNNFIDRIYPSIAGSFYFYNFWNSAEKISYRYNNQNYKKYLGNFWSRYDGRDDDGDGIGDTIIGVGQEKDSYPLMESFENYFQQNNNEWSFAVITDLHIGWGIPDYGKPGYGADDNEPGQDYYLTDRLERTVDWINQNGAFHNTKFVLVLGDITDTAEYSEFLKAREILNGLDIPYIPLIGNHDIIPYISRPNFDPDDRTQGPIIRGIGDKWEHGESLGDEYFQQIFWNDNLQNIQKINALFPDFQQQANSSYYYQNYAFTHRGINFISLDFASRGETLQLFSPLNAIDPVDTQSWLENGLDNCNGSKTILLTHYPLRDIAGGFFVGSFLPIKNSLINNSCQILNFSGHTHAINKQFLENKYEVDETESLSQVSFLDYQNRGEFLRLVKIRESSDNIQISPDIFIKQFPDAINPFIKIFPEQIGIFQPVTFIAEARNRTEEEISTYVWQFDDGEQYVTQNNIYVKALNKTGIRKVKLTVNDIYGNSESVNWNFEVGSNARMPQKVIMVNGIFIPMVSTGVDLREPQNAQNTTVWVTVSDNDLNLIGGLKTHFELAETDVDLSDFVGDTDLLANKSFLHMDEWPDLIEREKILYIPSSGKGKVYICPQAKSLDEVSQDCAAMTVLNEGQTLNGMSLNTINYEGQDYYQIIGVTGTGGGEWSDEPEFLSFEEQVEIIGFDYDDEDILLAVVLDIGDERSPLLLSELKEAKINLTKYLPWNKKVMAPGQKKKLLIKYKFLETIGNEYQGKSLNIDFNFTAFQEK